MGPAVMCTVKYADPYPWCRLFQRMLEGLQEQDEQGMPKGFRIGQLAGGPERKLKPVSRPNLSDHSVGYRGGGSCGRPYRLLQFDLIEPSNTMAAVWVRLKPCSIIQAGGMVTALGL